MSNGLVVVYVRQRSNDTPTVSLNDLQRLTLQPAQKTKSPWEDVVASTISDLRESFAAQPIPQTRSRAALDLVVTRAREVPRPPRAPRQPRHSFQQFARLPCYRAPRPR